MSITWEKHDKHIRNTSEAHQKCIRNTWVRHVKHTRNARETHEKTHEKRIRNTWETHENRETHEKHTIITRNYTRNKLETQEKDVSNTEELLEKHMKINEKETYGTIFRLGQVEVNDQIVEVDGKSLHGYTNQQAVEMLRATGAVVRYKGAGVYNLF